MWGKVNRLDIGALIAFETLDVLTSVTDGVAIVSVAGELDPFSAPQLKRAVADAMQPGVSEVAVDLAGVTFIDARGLDSVLEAGDRVRESGRRFAVERRSMAVVRIEQLVAAIGAPGRDRPGGALATLAS